MSTVPSRILRPQLRLFAGGGSGEGPPEIAAAGPTLPEFFEQHVLPHCLVAARPLTVAAYRDSLARWSETTGNPHVVDISDAHAAAFLRGLRARTWRGRPLADNTVRKHCLAIEALLKLAGPRDRSNRRGAGLLDSPPPIDAPRVEIQEVDDAFSLVEIGQWLAAAEAALRPLPPSGAGWRAAGWWRAMILFAFNVGLRRETLLAVRKSWFEQDAHGRWLAVAKGAVKGRRGKRLYCNRAAWEAIQPLWPSAGEGPIFAWPYCASYLHAELRRTLARSAIPAARHFGFHGLRKACGTELAAINPLAASMQLGHALGRDLGANHARVTQDHYAHRRLLADALERLPQPVWSDADDAQLRLF